jgi:hypothetical protein
MSLWAVLADVLPPPPPAQPARGNPFESAELIWGMIALMGALLAGAAAVYFADKWRKNAAKQDDGTGALSSYRDMYNAGEISADEYAELKKRAAGKLKAQQPGAAVQPAPTPGPAPNPPPSAPDQSPPAQ